jgi:hypothetical protein
VVGVRVAHHDPVELLADAPAPEEVHHVGPLLGPAGVYEVLFAARLHEHPVALPHVYEAHREGTRWRRGGAAKGFLSGQGTTGRREDEQE